MSWFHRLPPRQLATNLSADSSAQACGGCGKHFVDQFAGGFVNRMLASLSTRGKICNGGDQPLRPSAVGTRDFRVQGNQGLQFFRIRNAGWQIDALKTADIAKSDLGSGDHASNELLQLSINHWLTCRTCSSFCTMRVDGLLAR